MKHTYQLTGMTCTSCEARVKTALLSISDVLQVEVSKEENTATISMEKHIPIGVFQTAIGGSDSKYKIRALQHSEIVESTKAWYITYKPILLIFLYINIVIGAIQFGNEQFDWMIWMRYFMAGFFLVFSFFKLLNLKGFKDSYVMYDIVAKRFPFWAYLYVFFELGLGLAYTLDFEPRITNYVTVVVMTISILGVLQTVLNKQKIQCACLGAVFNLPMSTVTIIEDGLMIGMGLLMIFH